MASIKKRPDGRWRARYRDEARVEHSRHFDKKEDGQRWLDEVTASIVTSTYVDPRAGNVTFGAFFERWATRQLWAPGTDRAMRLAVASTTFHDVPMRSLRLSHLESWVKVMATKPRGRRHAPGLEPGTIRTRVNNVRAVLRGAVRDRVIGVDPSEGLTLPRARRAEAAMTIPASEEVGALISSADDYFASFLGVAAFAGLRLGEAAGLQVGDVDFLSRRLKVERQVQRLTGGGVDIRRPKFASERVVYLPDDLLELLSRHIEQHVERAGVPSWMFRGAPGHPPHQNTVGYWWRKTCKAAGIDAFTFHDLRHYYASGLIAAGCDVVTVQRALGHANATTTLNTYAHLWPTAEDRTRTASQGLMESAGLRTPADYLRTTSPI